VNFDLIDSQGVVQKAEAGAGWVYTTWYEMALQFPETSITAEQDRVELLWRTVIAKRTEKYSTTGSPDLGQSFHNLVNFRIAKWLLAYLRSSSSTKEFGTENISYRQLLTLSKPGQLATESEIE
jgi:hypothetical protein